MTSLGDFYSHETAFAIARLELLGTTPQGTAFTELMRGGHIRQYEIGEDDKVITTVCTVTDRDFATQIRTAPTIREWLEDPANNDEERIPALVRVPAGDEWRLAVVDNRWEKGRGQRPPGEPEGSRSVVVIKSDVLTLPTSAFDTEDD